MAAYLDSYYKKGSTHEVCEDYALTGSCGNMHYSIVSDGCSACANVDIGARLLSLIAANTLRYYYRIGVFKEQPIPFTIEKIKKVILKRIADISSFLGLENSAFSATLLITVNILGGPSFFLGWGDGYFIEKKKDSTLFTKIEFQSSAPFFLNYYTQEDSPLLSAIDQYKDFSGVKKVIVSEYLSKKGASPVLIGTTEANPVEFYYFKAIDKSSGPMHLITCSDGGNTFVSGQTNSRDTQTDIHTLISLTDFKAPLPGFAKKAYEKYKAAHSSREMDHYDDLSLTAIMTNEILKSKKVHA